MTWLGLTADEWTQAAWTIATAGIANAACAILGCYLVLRRMSLLGDAISHAVLPGIVVAFLLTGKTAPLPMLAGAMVVGVLTSFLTQALHGYGKVPEDASMGVVFTSLFALGVLLMRRYVDLDPDCVLYGRLEFVGLIGGETVSLAGWEVPQAAASLGVALAATLAFVALFWKELKIVSFDPALATAMGLNALVVHYLLMGMVAMVTVAAFDAVGSVLVVAMLIVPAAAAHLLTDRFGRMMVWAVAIGVVSAVLGYVGASRFNTVAAGMTAVAAGAQLGLAVLFAPRHGLLSKAWHRFSLSLRIASEDVVALLYRHEEAAAAGRQAAISTNLLREVSGGGLMGKLALPWLRRHGEVEPAGLDTWRLTDEGRHAAQSLVRSHRLWEAYLGEHFELPLDHLHEPAERVEHFIGPQLQERLASELARPGIDPHGKQIPPSESQEA